MLKIRIAEKKDINEIYKIHLECIKMLAKSKELGATTFLDKRERSEIKSVLSKNHSYIIIFNGKVVGYFLYDTYKDGLISKGLMLKKEVEGLGLVKLIHNLTKGVKKYYIVSKYNTRSLKNILALGLRYKETINENDSLYG